MLEALIGTLQAFPRGLVFVALGLVVLVAAKLVRDLATHYNVEQEISEKQNLAVALRLSGYFIGVILIFLGALYQPLTLVGVEGLGFDLEYGIQVIRVLAYSLAGIVALNLVRLLMNRLVLYKFNIEEEIVRGQNVGTGAAEFGMYIAVGLVVAGAVSGEGTGSELEAALTALAFFAMGTALLVVFALFYELTTHFDIHDEIEGNNAAVGVVFGGNLIAIGLVTLKAVFGEFTGWGGKHRGLPHLRSDRLRTPLRDAPANRLANPAHRKGLRRPGRGPELGGGIYRKRRCNQLRDGPLRGDLAAR